MRGKKGRWGEMKRDRRGEKENTKNGDAGRKRKVKKPVGEGRKKLGKREN
jgi:hypothetical protein